MNDQIGGGRVSAGASRTLMALTGAVATCAGAPAAAQTYVTTTLPSPISFDMLSASAQSYGIDLNGDGVTDFLLQSGGGSNAISLVGQGTASTQHFLADASEFNDRSTFATGSDVKGKTGSVPLISTNENTSGNSINANGWQPTASGPLSGYAEVYFTDNGVSTTGFVGGTMTESKLPSGATDETFALTSYGTVTPAAPEPATWALFAVGAGVTGMALRRRRRATPAQLLAA